jgi:putative intracellular protease/amidase
MHRVAALCLDGLVAFDLTAATQVFLAASTEAGTPLYEVSCCSPGGAEVTTTTGFALRPPRDLGSLPAADTVVVPGYFAVLDRPPEPAIEALRVAAARGARVISVCTGAFALAHAGLLDGRRATTHWAHAEQLGTLFPAVEVEPGSLYVDEGDVMTSAGLSAGIDLALHVVPQGLRAAAGERVARRMVAAPPPRGRPGQFIKRPRWRSPARWRRPDAGPPSGSRSRSTSPRWRGTPASARAPSPGASARRPGPRRCAGCWPSACSRRDACWRRSDLPIDDCRLARGLRHGRLAARALPPRHRTTPTPTAARSGPASGSAA